MAALDVTARAIRIDPAFQNAQVQQAHIGWEWEKYRVATVGVSYLFARGTHLPRAEEIGSAPIASRAVAFRSEGESIYNGFTYYMRMRFFESLFYTASATFARGDDTDPGVSLLPPGTPT